MFRMKLLFSQKKIMKNIRKNDKANHTEKRKAENNQNQVANSLTRLNKFIANAGVCSRREADKLIASGMVKVNGVTVSEMGQKVGAGDKVEFDGKILQQERKYYLLLNKPKGFITTTDDPYERKTVMSLIKNACNARLYPVGRLDMATTGLLLFTNDGELAKKLIHPKHSVKKIYHVVLDKKLTKNDMLKISEGFDLEDGPIKVDDIAYVSGAENKKEVGVQLHSGRNRIIRRLFEELGYRVVRLDRVSFAGLTKKDIPRGKWRHLTQKEISYLKMLK
ncbi:MAG: rRNA pseudouridine synthase [Chlorobi bacterium]|nr:rRNA pseudouridine synthase [Chlorobiota bacterium]